MDGNVRWDEGQLDWKWVDEEEKGLRRLHISSSGDWVKGGSTVGAASLEGREKKNNEDILLMSDT